ncbi:MAG: SCO family protein [Rhodospirillales bacterium]|nr:SCO family protein [Rhodospirillales bacterium]
MRIWRCKAPLGGKAGKRPPRPAGGAGRARRLTLAAVAALVLGGAGLLLDGVSHPGDGRIGGNFRLHADTGAMVSPASFGGRYLLIYFGYTHCADVCPTTLAAMTAAMDRLGAAGARIQPLFITVDPTRDTPAVLRRYLAAFGDKVLGLTGNAGEIAAVERAYHVSASIQPGQDGHYSIEHSSVLMLTAPDGRFLAPIRADASPAVIAATLSRYLS